MTIRPSLWWTRKKKELKIGIVFFPKQSWRMFRNGKKTEIEQLLELFRNKQKNFRMFTLKMFTLEMSWRSLFSFICS
jgi:hypothetical protein